VSLVDSCDCLWLRSFKQIAAAINSSYAMALEVNIIMMAAVYILLLVSIALYWYLLTLKLYPLHELMSHDDIIGIYVVLIQAGQ
jgi:hypothetical protein